jgi:large subunit ribosomal protein L25
MATKSTKSGSTGPALVFNARSKTGTTGARAERGAGHVPGVVYGHGSEPMPVSVEARALEDLLHGGHSRQLIEATLNGRGDTVLLREIQRDPISRKVLHADFQRVSRSEKIYTTLRVITVGVAPGVKDSGGVLDVVTHELEILGPADQVPEQLEVDVSHLGLHDHVTAAQVKLPEGFTMSTTATQIVVSVESSRTEADAAAAPTPEAAVPTVAETAAPTTP